MSDDFLYRFRRPPRPEFAEELYRRIHRGSSRILLRRRVTLGLAVLCAISALAFALLPSVRLAVAQGIRTIGGIVFYEMGSLLGPSPEAEVHRVPSVELEQAQAELPCDPALPEWLPEGLKLRSVQVVSKRQPDSPAMAILVWGNAYDESPLTIFIQCPAPVGMTIPPEAVVEEVEVNGQPAAVVYGKWINQRWEPRAWPSLLWRSGDVMYSLISSSPQITAETLVRIAESIP